MKKAWGCGNCKLVFPQIEHGGDCPQCGKRLFLFTTYSERELHKKTIDTKSSDKP